MLYNLSSESYKLPFYVDKDGDVITAAADGIPLMRWPNGRWCYPANVFMLEQYYRGLSRKNRGGTLAVTAAHLSHLIKYCDGNGLDFYQLGDNDFTMFIRTLIGETRSGDATARVRGDNQVISIGRTCLAFLKTIGRIYQINDLVSPTGQVRAEQKEVTIRVAGLRRGSIIKKFLHHRSFPTADPMVRRHPISSSAIKAIMDSIAGCSASLFLRKRRYVMLKLLEVTGGRRSEVAALTVESVYAAVGMDAPMLKLMTAKKRGGREEYRFVPISSHDLIFLVEYIEKNRRRIVRGTCGLSNDDGYVLISETTGKKLRPNTITQEIHSLRDVAGVKERICPHLFRHRYITKLFVALIEQHQFQNADSFRKALLDVEGLKQKVLEFTGQSSIASLERYIDLAFEEIANFKKSYDLVQARLALDSFRSTLAHIGDELTHGESVAAVAAQLNRLLDGLELDLDRFSDGTSASVTRGDR